MLSREEKTIVAIVASLILLVSVVVLAFAWCYLVGWLVVAVLEGFGVAAPFWPTVGGVFLAQLALGMVGTACGRK